MVVQNSNEFNFLMNRNKNTQTDLQKNLEKLASGYQVNRAADDAAGLAVSEKMRGILASLGQGVKNINDGISYIRSVDGSSQEIHNILHRLYVLADQASNGTYDNEVDRRSIDLEYQQLLDEIDQMTDLANFNYLPLFEKHLEVYGKDTGNICHDEKPIIIDDSNDELTIGYTINGTHKEYTVLMKHGRYLTPEELADEIDTDLFKNAKELIIGVDEKKRFTMQVEGGDLDYIIGSGSDIFYKSTPGNSRGCLIGVTRFQEDAPDVTLAIQRGWNDEIKFRLSNEDVVHTIYLPTDNYSDRLGNFRRYSCSQLIDELNRQFEADGIGDIVKATKKEYENGECVIMLESEDAITGLAGNFIRIDMKSGQLAQKQSPLYDISYYADEENFDSHVQGTKVLTDGLHVVRDRNEYFMVKFSDYDSEGEHTYKISLLDDDQYEADYTILTLVDKIKEQFELYDIRADVTYEEDKLRFTTYQVGKECNIEVLTDAANVPSDFMVYDLFDGGTLRAVTPTTKYSSYRATGWEGQKSNKGLTFNFTDSNNKLVFNFTPRDRLTTAVGTAYSVEFTLSGTGVTINDVVDQLNQQLKNNNPELATQFYFYADSNYGKLGIASKDPSNSGDAHSISNTVADSTYKITCSTGSSAYSTLVKYVKTLSSVERSAGGTIGDLYTDRSPTGASSISKTSGLSGVIGVGSYKDQTTSQDKEILEYITYTPLDYTYEDGRTDDSSGSESYVGRTTNLPASATVTGLKALFNVDGNVCKKSGNIRFDFTGYDGQPRGSVTINPEGKTYEEFLDALRNSAELQGFGTLTVDDSAGSFTIKSFSDKINDGDGASIRISGLYKGEVNPVANSDPRATRLGTTNQLVLRASCTIPNVVSTLPATISSTDPATANNVLKIKYTGSNKGAVNYNLTIPDGSYRYAYQVRDAINAAISAADGGDPQIEAVLTSDGNGIMLLGKADNAGTSISIDNAAANACPFGMTYFPPTTTVPSDAYRDNVNNTWKKPATMSIASAGDHMPYTPEADTTLKIKYQYVDATNTLTQKTINVTLKKDVTYDRAALKSAIENSTDNDEYGVKVDFSGNTLKLTTKEKSSGDGAAFISFDSGDSKLDKYLRQANSKPGGVISGNTLKWPSSISNPAYSSLNKRSLVIDGNNNCINLMFKDQNYLFYIPQGTYTSTNDLLTNGISKAKTADNKLITDYFDIIKTNEYNYSLRGYYDVLTFRVKGANVGYSDYVSVGPQNTSFIFTRVQDDNNPSEVSFNDTRCRVKGSRDISGTTKINYWDNTMTFDYGNASGVTSVTIRLGDDLNAANPSRNYTADEIVAAVQQQIDAQIGTKQNEVWNAALGAKEVITEHKLEVSLEGGKLVIQAPSASTEAGVGNFRGLLFDRIMQGAEYDYTPHEYVHGITNGETLAYIVGRNDLEPTSKDERESGKNVLIYTGINDQMVFDFNYNGEVHEVNFRIPGGAYTREELVNALQEGGRAFISELTDENGEPFAPDFFNVSLGLDDLRQFGVGENNTGISSDNKIVMWCKMPDDGSHDGVKVIIDGVRGTMAYRVFYDSSMSPSPSTIHGCADLSNGLTIDGTNNVLTFQMNGKDVNICMTSGEYKDCDAVCDMLNSVFEDYGYDVAVMNNDNHLLFYSTKNGNYAFTRFMGNGADDVFYGTEKRDGDEEIGIQTGRRTDSYIWIKKTRVDDHLMRINTTGVTTVERAQKAMNRLVEANKYLSRWRALSGANENRAEHTLSRINVYIENLSAAESQIRDTNVADEVAKLTKNQILMQAQKAMFSHVTEHQSSALNVLA